MDAAIAKTETERLSSEPSANKQDRWLRWPAVTILSTVFCLMLLCGLPGLLSFVLIPIVALGGPEFAVAFVVLTGIFVVQKKPRKAVSILIALLLPILFWKPIVWATDCLHLGLTINFGIGELGDDSASAEDKFSVYDWSVGLAGGPNTFLIYDVTDEIAVPLERHKFPIASENGFGNECAGRVRHLLGHYYVCTF